MMTSFFRAVADELGAAWQQWRESAEAFERIKVEAAALMQSSDLNALLHSRTSDAFVTFDMACRRIRLYEYAAWSEPANEAERALLSLTTILNAHMREA